MTQSLRGSGIAHLEVVMLDRHTYQLTVRNVRGVMVEHFSNEAAAIRREQALRALLVEREEAAGGIGTEASNANGRAVELEQRPAKLVA